MQAPDQCRLLLQQNPQLVYALFQALVVMNVVDSAVMQVSIIHRASRWKTRLTHPWTIANHCESSSYATATTNDVWDDDATASSTATTNDDTPATNAAAATTTTAYDDGSPSSANGNRHGPRTAKGILVQLLYEYISHNACLAILATLDASAPTHTRANPGPSSRPTATGPRFGKNSFGVFFCS